MSLINGASAVACAHHVPPVLLNKALPQNQRIVQCALLRIGVLPNLRLLPVALWFGVHVAVEVRRQRLVERHRQVAQAPRAGQDTSLAICCSVKYLLRASLSRASLSRPSTAMLR